MWLMNDFISATGGPSADTGDKTSILKQLEDDKNKKSILQKLEEEQKKDEEEARKNREQHWRNTKRGLILCGGMITVSIGYMFYSFGEYQLMR